DALEILRGAAVDGVEVVAATPHVRDDYPTTPAVLERGLADVRQAVADAGLPIRVVAGGEIALDRLPRLSQDDLARFALGGGRHVLLEAPYVGWPLDLAERLFQLQLHGFVPVLAHPERNLEVQGEPELLRAHVERGLLVQVTAASLDGRLGRRSAATARVLLARGLAHLLASDAHGAEIREVGLSRAAAAVGDEPLARWLVRDVPAAILEGTEPPERPAPARRRLAWRGRGRSAG
ncbi:MAG TPA: CpsB/CapC family capsule biosynthesis tyrosine phosphatase, partial [Gaiellaceae bacterium]|nr:CpsB/CapC family capsule biosynthesis tyrosine phosphatase [Gaiellaceae bacterium]